MPTFDGSEGSIIPTATAARYTTDFRTDYPNNKKAYFVGKYKIKDLLDQTGAIGIRVYLGEKLIDNQMQIIPVLVATDEDGEDIIGICVDDLTPCPPTCDTNSPLYK